LYWPWKKNYIVENLFIYKKGNNKNWLELSKFLVLTAWEDYFAPITTNYYNYWDWMLFFRIWLKMVKKFQNEYTHSKKIKKKLKFVKLYFCTFYSFCSIIGHNFLNFSLRHLIENHPLWCKHKDWHIIEEVIVVSLGRKKFKNIMLKANTFLGTLRI